MPASDDAKELAQRRFREMLVAIGRERGGSLGWKKEIAAQLGISAGHLSRVLAGTRGVSHEVLLKAARIFAFSPAYFASDAGSFRDFQSAGPGGGDSTIVGGWAEGASGVGATYFWADHETTRATLLRLAQQIVEAYSRDRRVPIETANGLALALRRSELMQALERFDSSTGRDRELAAVRLAVETEALLVLLTA